MLFADRQEVAGDEDHHFEDFIQADVLIRDRVVVDLLIPFLEDSSSRCNESLVIHSEFVLQLDDVVVEVVHAGNEESVARVVDIVAARGGLVADGVEVRHDVAYLQQVEEAEGETLQTFVAIEKMSLVKFLPYFRGIICRCLGRRQLCLHEGLWLDARLLKHLEDILLHHVFRHILSYKS
jgi:hypothetical protein